MRNTQMALNYSVNCVDSVIQGTISYFDLVTYRSSSDYNSSIINFNEAYLEQQILNNTNPQELCKSSTLFLGKTQKLPDYIFNNVFPYVKNIVMDSEKNNNINKLRKIEKLKDGWDGAHAKAFNDTLIKTVLNLIIDLNFQPEIFPTACETIQIEYEKDDGAYLEIEIGNNDIAKVFMIGSEGNEQTTFIAASSHEINAVVNSFYE